MQLYEYIEGARLYWRANPGQRRGQAYMNWLHEVNADLYHAVPWEIDPFHKDSLIPEFTSWLAERWPDYTQQPDVDR